MVESGLTKQEVVGIAKSVFSNFPVMYNPPCVEECTEETILEHNPNAYSYVLVSQEGKTIYPNSEQKNKTEEQAKYALDLRKKEGYTGFLTFNLKAQPYVVFDFDSKEGVDKFKHLLDQTRGCINAEGTSMHLWFEVNTLYPTIHYAQRGGKPLDLLGNTNETNVDFKPNKPYNNLKPMALTEELFNTFNDYGNSKWKQ